MKTAHSIATALILGSTLAVSAAPAMARVDFEFSFGIPGVYVQPAPVYVEPAPVYIAPRPVYRHPYPVYGYEEPGYARPYPHYDQPRLVYENSYQRGHPYRGRPHHRDLGHRDLDRDGVPNFRDGDRDGDGVSNRDDRRPNDSYRY